MRIGIERDQRVGWAKRPGANASGGVPTVRREDVRFKKWWALNPSYVLDFVFAHSALLNERPGMTVQPKPR